MVIAVEVKPKHLRNKINNVKVLAILQEDKKFMYNTYFISYVATNFALKTFN